MTTGPSAKGQPGSPAARRARGGFTLLELVLVMVIICTVLGMAAPSLKGFFASRDTQNAAAQIVALTQLARSQAVSEGRTYRLNFDIEQGLYWLTAQQRGAFAEVPGGFGRAFSLPQGVSLELEVEGVEEPEWIAFYPDGRTQQAVIRLTGRQGDTATIACAAPAEPFQVVAE